MDGPLFSCQKERSILQVLSGTISGCDVLLENSPETALLHFVRTLSLYADVICCDLGLSSSPRIGREGVAKCDHSSLAGCISSDGQ